MSSASDDRAFRPQAGDDVLLELQRPKPTGRFLVTFEPEFDLQSRADIVYGILGQGVTTLGLSPETDASGGPESATSRLLARHGYAVVDTTEEDPGAAPAMMRSLASENGVSFVRPEFFLFANELPVDTQLSTWGVQATRAFESRFTGKGIKLAVLDTGIDLGHPDFVGRTIVHESFVSGEPVDDVQGHGTHCAGTAAGWKPQSGRLRYGVAYEADLYVAKVLNDRGAGREGDIIAALLWAIENRCEVISMSLGRAVRPGEIATPQYEEVARLALDEGCLIVAAAGNDSSRQYGLIAPVSEPANAPSIMAVAALDVDLSVASFSNGTINPKGGQVDIAAPGVQVISSVPRPKLFDRFAGTSMACPHVAGIAALWAQSDPALRGAALWQALTRSAAPISA